MAKCVQCGHQLSGRQTKYCSRECKNEFNNVQYQSYLAQQSRGKKRKLELIELLGGCCTACGYDKNYAALEFHHKEPGEKAFSLDLRSLSNRKFELILEEVKKCNLVCSNCHTEIHNPDCALT